MHHYLNKHLDTYSSWGEMRSGVRSLSWRWFWLTEHGCTGRTSGSSCHSNHGRLRHRRWWREHIPCRRHTSWSCRRKRTPAWWRWRGGKMCRGGWLPCSWLWLVGGQDWASDDIAIDPSAYILSCLPPADDSDVSLCRHCKKKTEQHLNCMFACRCRNLNVYYPCISRCERIT